MKHALIVAALAGVVLIAVTAATQTAPPAGAPEAAPAPAGGSETNVAAPAPATTPDAPAPADTNAPAGTTTPAEAAAPSSTAPVPVTVAAADPAPATSTPSPDHLVASTNEPAAEPGSVIPMILMEDVPLTEAIRNLARQARLNYVLDPKIGFGQLGPDGKVVPQPTITIRWENVTAESALNALLGNYGLQLSEDPKSKIARITIRDPAAPDPLVTKIFQLKYASPSNLLASVSATLTDKRSKVVADTRTSQLVLLATDKELQAVDTLVDRLDAQPKQVLIEARLVETSVSPSSIKGINWAGTLQGQNISVGNNLQYAPVPQNSANPPLASLFPKMLLDTAHGFSPATAFLDADGVNLVLSFLNQNSEARVLSAPRTVTLDNEPATISVTRATPIINVTASTVQTTGGSSIMYTNLGVILSVTPRISANNYVNLKITPEVSRQFDTVTKVINGQTFQADEYDIRRVNTMVMIPSGNTLVMGGMVQDEVQKSNIKVPVLGDIPGLGLLFRMDSKNRQKSNLLIFITPTIVHDEDFQPTASGFLKTPVPKKDAVEGDWGWWDSGAPKDWSKKKKTDTGSGAGTDNGAGVFAPVP